LFKNSKNNHDTESRNKEKKQGYAVYLAQIEALSKVANLIASGMYLEELLRLIVRVTAEVMHSKISSLMLLDEEKRACGTRNPVNIRCL